MATNLVHYLGAALRLNAETEFQALDPKNGSKADKLNSLTESTDEFEPAPLAGFLRMNRAEKVGAEILEMDEVPEDLEI